MSHTSAQGDSDATIIPFPLHRVSPPPPTDEQSLEEPTAEEPAEGAEIYRLSVAPVSEAEPAPALSRERGDSLGDAFAAPSTAERRAHNVSLHALAGRSQSRREVENRLRDRGLDENVLQAEVESLVASGLIDDHALALELVDRHAHRGGMGRSAVAQRLRSRHVPQDAIDAALDTLDESEESSKLEALARERLRKMGNLAPDVAKRRLVGFLQRKGFGGPDLFAVVSRVMSSDDSHEGY